MAASPLVAAAPEPEPTPAPAPAPVAEPEPAPAPVAEPEPTPVVQEAPAAPEPVVEQAPAPEPVKVPEPVKEPEPVKVPEPEPEKPVELNQRMAAFTVEDLPKSPQVAAAQTSSPVGGSFRVKNDKCAVCSKPVYPMDKMVADKIVFHKTCMRCAHCDKVLGLGNFAALNGKYYCKPHFKQLFQAKGNYSDGFGEEKPTAKWEPQVAGYALGKFTPSNYLNFINADFLTFFFFRSKEIQLNFFIIL